MFVALIGFLLMAYLVVCGLVKAIMYKKAVEDCGDCGGPYLCVYSSFHHEGAFMVSLIWPLMVPYLFGQTLHKGNRKEAKRAKELAEAQHHAEMARYRRIETEELDRQLGV